MTCWLYSSSENGRQEASNFIADKSLRDPLRLELALELAGVDRKGVRAKELLDLLHDLVDLIARCE
jgi:hypothetical protein